MKKNILILAMAALVAIPSLTSCKKGENDPFLSLKSRKGRLTGEWKLVEGEIKETSGGTTETFTYTETELTYKSGSSSQSFSNTQSITINKDYTYETEVIFEGDKSTEKGSWAFLGKNKELELEKKQAVIFYPSESTNGTNTDEWGGTATEYTNVIDQLKNKELIIKIDESTTSGGSTTTTEGTLTFEKH